jgi:hypothetical protein
MMLVFGLHNHIVFTYLFDTGTTIDGYNFKHEIINQHQEIKFVQAKYMTIVCS